MGRLDWGFHPTLQPATSRPNSPRSLEAPRRPSARSAAASFRLHGTAHIRAQSNHLKRRTPFQRNARTRFGGRGACGSEHRDFSRSHDSRFIRRPVPSERPVRCGTRSPRSALSTVEPSLLARTDQATSCCPTLPARPTFEPGPHPAPTDLSPIGQASGAGSDTAPAHLLAPLLDALLAALPTRLARAQRTVPPYRQTSIRQRSTRTRRSIR